MSDREQERTERIERAVLGRIDRRAAVVRGVARGTVAVVLLGAVIGGIASLRPVSGSAGGSSLAEGGSRAASAPMPSPAPAQSVATSSGGLYAAKSVTVRCRATSSTSSSSRAARVDELTPAIAASACQDVLQRETAVPVVLCTAHGATDAFPADADPATLCRRNGEQPLP